MRTNKYSFIKKVEAMITPKDIATLQLLAPLNKFIPKLLQNNMIHCLGTDCHRADTIYSNMDKILEHLNKQEVLLLMFYLHQLSFQRFYLDVD